MTLSKGFSLPELLIVIAIAGLFGGLALTTGQAQWQREQVNKVAIELSGWLESARRAALRGDLDSDNSGCSITINNGTLSTGSTLATATCLPDQPLTIDNLGSRINLTVASDTTNPISVSPRGTRSGDPVTITLTLNPSGKQRCVTISGLLALISPGKVSSSGTCELNQRF